MPTPAATGATIFMDSPRVAMLVFVEADIFARTFATRPDWSAARLNPRSVDAAISDAEAKSMP
jgi:hypothetical protein